MNRNFFYLQQNYKKNYIFGFSNYVWPRNAVPAYQHSQIVCCTQYTEFKVGHRLELYKVEDWL